MATYSINNKIDFLRHNNKFVKRDKKIKEIRIKTIHVFLIILFFSIIATGVLFFGKFLMTWDKLNIKSFVLEKSEEIDHSLIKNILQNYNGNILAIDLSKLRDRFLQIHQIKDVTISRILPSTIKISFEPRNPILQFLHDSVWKSVDNEGIILNKSNLPFKNLIKIKNIKKKQLFAILSFTDELNSIKDKINYVGYKKPFGIFLRLKEENIRVYPGGKDFKKKINYYFTLRNRAVLKHLKIISIDLRFKDRIYLEYDKKNFDG